MARARCCCTRWRTPGSEITALTLHLADRQRRLARVRLAQEVGLGTTDFVRTPGGWTFSADAPDVGRLEYLLDVEDHNEHRWTLTDPTNPLRAPGAFGEKSVLELDGYVRPAWLGDDGVDATLESRDVTILDTPVSVGLWTPTALTGDAPLLLVHDGPEFASLGGLTQWLAAMIASGELPPMRAALLDPGDRNDWYAANDGYAEAVAAIVPTLPATTVIGVGASLGALAMLHLHRRHPGLLDALFLQSGSFFTHEHDAQESGFSAFDAVTSFVGELHAATADPAPVPTVLTCGTVEENLANNRQLAVSLARLGYEVSMTEVRDAHNFTAWRDALHPHLTELVRRAT